MIGAGAGFDRGVRARAVRRLVVLGLAVVVAGMLPPVAGLASPGPAGRPVAVIVRTDPAVQPGPSGWSLRPGGGSGAAWR